LPSSLRQIWEDKKGLPELWWYQDDPRLSLEAIVKQVARRFRQKNGKYPSIVYVHPSAARRPVRVSIRRDIKVSVRPRLNNLMYHYCAALEK
jgi:hypothetical protein